jgi:hypothetical protein
MAITVTSQKASEKLVPFYLSEKNLFLRFQIDQHKDDTPICILALSFIQIPFNQI